MVLTLMAACGGENLAPVTAQDLGQAPRDLVVAARDEARDDLATSPAPDLAQLPDLARKPDPPDLVFDCTGSPYPNGQGCPGKPCYKDLFCSGPAVCIADGVNHTCMACGHPGEPCCGKLDDPGYKRTCEVGLKCIDRKNNCQPWFLGCWTCG